MSEIKLRVTERGNLYVDIKELVRSDKFKELVEKYSKADVTKKSYPKYFFDR